MAQIASELLIERLADWGVDTVFGLPGDGINGIMEGLRRNQDKVRFVLVHHEEAAAFMATAHAKATGRLGVCLATSGPGGIHLLNGLYDAKLDHVPVLAITGMQETSVLGTGYQQEVAMDKLYADVAEYDQLISNPVQLPAVVDLAIRTAYARRGGAARAGGTAGGRGGARRPDRQDAVRQGLRARRLPVHHRRDRAAGHQAVRGTDGRDRHAFHGRHELPVHRPPAQ